jgi:hypothetical protein
MALNMKELFEESERLADQQGGDFLDNFVKMPEKAGHVSLRLLSKAGAQVNEGGLYMATRIHRVNNKSLHCPRTLQGGKWMGDCPVCRYYSWLWKESEKKSPDEATKLQSIARAIKPIERYYYNAIVRSVLNEKTNEIEKNVGPKILSVGKMIHSMIIRAMVGNEQMEEKPLGDVTDVKNGRDFKIVKTLRQSGKDVFPNYSDSKFLDVSPAGIPEEVAKWVAALHDLKALRVIKDNEYLKKQLKIHLGIEKDDSQGDGFDPSEFQRSADDETVVVTTSKKESPVEKTSTSTAAAVVVEGAKDEVLADEDFLSQLKKMG